MFVARSSLLCVVAAVLACVSQAFLLPSAPVSASSSVSRSRVAPLYMGLFDSIKKGFENEAQGQPAPNAGLKNVRRVIGQKNDDVRPLVVLLRNGTASRTTALCCMIEVCVLQAGNAGKLQVYAV